MYEDDRSGAVAAGRQDFKSGVVVVVNVTESLPSLFRERVIVGDRFREKLKAHSGTQFHGDFPEPFSHARTQFCPIR